MAVNADFSFLSHFPYDGAKMYNFLPLAIKRYDGLKIERNLKKYIYDTLQCNTIFLAMLIDILIAIYFVAFLHYPHPVLRFFCYIL